MEAYIFVDSETIVSLPSSSRSVTHQGLAGSFLLHKFLPELGDSILAISSFTGNNNAVKVCGINLLFFKKPRYSFSWKCEVQVYLSRS